MECHVCRKKCSSARIITICKPCLEQYPETYENGIIVIASHAEEWMGFVNDAVSVLKSLPNVIVDKEVGKQIKKLIEVAEKYPSPQQFYQMKVKFMEADFTTRQMEEVADAKTKEDTDKHADDTEPELGADETEVQPGSGGPPVDTGGDLPG